MAQLQRSLGAVQYFSIGFGGIVGVGWIVYMGIWFTQAGPLGTVIAFLVGGLLMGLIGLCYAEAAAMFPVAGGEAAYAFSAFGQAAAFAVGWALVLMMTAVVPYVSVSLAWILDALVPGIGGPVLYSWRGQSVTVAGLVIALGWTLWLGYLNLKGVHAAAKFQDWLTYGKIAISLLFFGAGIVGGSTANLQPLFQTAPSGSVVGGMLAVLATTPWFLGGFNMIPQLLEERTSGTSSKTLGLIIVGSLLAAAGYYALAAISAGMVAPWRDMASQPLPVAVAFRQAFGSPVLARVVLTAGLFGIITVGNGASIAASRLLFALGRARLITPTFTRLHPQTGAPTTAILFVTIFALLGSFLGRGGIAPIVNVGAAAGSFAYLLTSLSVWRLRRSDPNRTRPYRMPAGLVIAPLAVVGSLFLLWSSLRQHWVDAGQTLPLEWVVMTVWAVVGLLMWRAAAGPRQDLDPIEQRRIVLGANHG